jgi:hypothetical protein
MNKYNEFIDEQRSLNNWGPGNELRSWIITIADGSKRCVNLILGRGVLMEKSDHILFKV